jgi:hypothetical protein
MLKSSTRRAEVEKRNTIMSRNPLSQLAKLFIVAVMTWVLAFDRCASAGGYSPTVKGKMDFYQIEPVDFSFHASWRSTRSYKSATNRLWYTYFQADENYAKKPLFVFLNGGPGCGTSMNLFAMNTAPYTLDRSRVPDGNLSELNEYSWTTLGNLLYIDAPNTGFSYMVGTDEQLRDSDFRLTEFIFGDNYNAFIDAAQVLRVVLKFLEDNSELRNNEVVFVGESFSGVRVSTMLNMLLYYKQYAEGKKVYKDSALTNLIEAQMLSVTSHKPPYSPAEVATQFKKQILIQPQIVDKYQHMDKVSALQKRDSLMDKLGADAKAEVSWREFLANAKKDKKDVAQTILRYLLYIKRDPYNCQKDADWTNNNEYSAMQALNSMDELSKITGGGNLRDVRYLMPNERKNALRFSMNSKIPIYASQIVNMLIFELPDDTQTVISMIPFWQKNLLDMDNPLKSLDYNLGALNDFDSYLVGTNPYIYLGFCMNSGGNSLAEVLYDIRYDRYDISLSDSAIYGTMFLENLALVDTFMTDAQNDIVVYAPTLVSQFDKGRFRKLVKSIDVASGNQDARAGRFTIKYKPNSIEGLDKTPAERNVAWYFYADSGHSVSSTQPKEFRDDVTNWINK